MDDEVRRLAGTMDELTGAVRSLRAERDQLGERVVALEAELADVRDRAKHLIAALTVRLMATGGVDPEAIDAAGASLAGGAGPESTEARPEPGEAGQSQ